MVPKTLTLLAGLLLLLGALPLRAVDPAPTHQLMLSTANQPTSDFNLGSSHVIGTLNAGRLPATALQTSGNFTLGGIFTFSVAPVFTDAAGTRASLGLGSVATHAASEFSTRLVIGAVQTASATLLVDTLVPFDCTAGNLVAAMPTSPVSGNRVALKKTDAGTNTLAVTARFNGAATASTLTLRLLDQGKTFLYDGTTWWAIYGDLSLPTLDSRFATAAQGALAATAVQPPAAPTITASGTTGIVSITPADPLSAPTIYYTLDGTTPTSASKRYQGPFVLPASATTTINAMAYLGVPGAVATQVVTTIVEDDTDVATWRTNVATAGGNLSALNIALANQFMYGVRLSGLRPKLQWVLLNCGDYAASGVPLLKDFGTNPTRNNATSAAYSEATGFTGNGSNIWFDTGYVPATAGQSASSASYVLRILNTPANAGTPIFSAYTSGTSLLNFFLNFGTGPQGSLFSTSSGVSVNNPTAGVYGFSRIGSTDLRYYVNGVLAGTIITATESGTAPTSSVQMFRGAQYSSGYSSAQISVATIGLGLTATDMANLSNLIRQFDAALGR